MKRYIIESVERFKKDVLSKGIYDILKWLLLSLFLIVSTNWIPFLGTIITTSFYVTVYEISLYSIVLIIILVILLNIFFQRKIKQIQKDNFTDELTQLKNYKALENYLPGKVNEFKNNNKSLSIILIDIDDFKNFNNTIGYNTADLILKRVGELLGLEKRSTDQTFRKFQRGDEFIVILEDTSLSGALIAAERRRNLIQNTSFEVRGIQYKLTVSCGVTELRKKEDDYISIIDRVSEALRLAKKEINKNNTKSVF